MNKEVQITITGIQSDGNETAEVVSQLSGLYYFKNNKHFVLYDEYPDEHNKSIVNKNTITFDEKNQSYRVELIKKGYQNSRLSFFPNEKYATSYKTPYGVFLMVVDTTRTEVIIDVDNIDIEVSYELFLNDEFISHNNIKIEVSSL